MENSHLYHRLVWASGEWMHEEWWTELGLQRWREHYSELPVAGRRALNLDIHRRRQHSGVVFGKGYEHTPIQDALLRSVERLPALMLALGLSLSRCPDYLLLRPYRQALKGWLSQEQLGQLWSIWQGGQCFPEVQPDELVTYAQRLGISALNHALSKDSVWQTVLYTLPYQHPNDTFPDNSAPALFIRLERFL